MTEKETEWDRSERRSTRIAVAIALFPIPVALIIAWALGSPPWRARTEDHAEGPTKPAAAAPGHIAH